MQLMIDTAVETSVGLRRIAAMLVFSADQIDGKVPAGTVAAPALTLATLQAEAASRVPSPPVEVMKADAGHASDLPDPAKVFGGASNVVPLVPSVPTVPSVPAATAPAVSPVASGPVELDAAGFPHDARIHSQPPTTNANGLWRIRRSTAKNPCPPELIQQVEAELRAIYPAKAAPVQLSTVMVPAVPVAPSPPGAGVVAVSVPPAPVTLPGVPTPGGQVSAPVAPGVPSGNDAFRVMMDKFSKEMGVNGKLNKTVMAPIFAALGVTGWQEFFKRPELIPNVTAEAERLLA